MTPRGALIDMYGPDTPELGSAGFDHRDPCGPNAYVYTSNSFADTERGTWKFCKCGAWGWYRREQRDQECSWYICRSTQARGRKLFPFPEDLSEACTAAYLVGGQDAVVALMAGARE